MAMLWFDETARNSNLLPVNANGLVRLRSPASRGSFGRTPTPVSRMPPDFVVLALPAFSICSKMSVSMVAEEDRDDGRRRFVRTEAVVVSSARDRVAEQALELVDGAEYRGAEHEELDVVVRRVTRGQEVVAEVVAHAPVEVLAGAVDAGKRLLVQEAREAEVRRQPPHRLHRHHLVIGGDVGVLEDRCDFILARRDFVVPRLDRHANLVQLALDFHHESEDALGDRAEVLILELLALRRLGAKERAAGVDEVGPRR